MLEASKSSREVLKSGSENMPGGSMPTLVFGRCDPPAVENAPLPPGLFAHHTTDAILAVFNSPFGPDVLVATDALSEGVDLHGCCRHLVHYELNPSPLSAIQRNGRLRRIDCWAARCNQPLRIAWPRFTGTRDERLVRIVQQRLKQFGLLLGGIAAPADPDAPDDAERERAVAFGRAKERLAKLSLSPL
jgi:superfamily II DNA/RNA helicase